MPVWQRYLIFIGHYQFAQIYLMKYKSNVLDQFRGYESTVTQTEYNISGKLQQNGVNRTALNMVRYIITGLLISVNPSQIPTEL